MNSESIFPHINDLDLKLISINPGVAFGQPVIHGTGIRTDVIVSRFEAGDSIDDLVRDYGCDRASIEEAIRFELWRIVR